MAALCGSTVHTPVKHWVAVSRHDFEVEEREDMIDHYSS